MKIRTRAITLAATMTALCAVTYMIPFAFFIPVTVAVTTLSLALSAFVGLAFGAISVMYSFLFPTGLVAVGFIQAPYIAIVPRVLAAVGGCLLYRLILKCFKPQKKRARVAAVAVSAAMSSILNTALVVGMFVLILPDLSFGGQTMIVYATELVIRGAIECVVAAAVTPPITLTLERAVLKRDRRRSDGAPAVSKPQVADEEQCAESIDAVSDGAKNKG